MDLCIGIDPSLNSTGICVFIVDNDTIIDTKFYIIHSGKLSKKEIKAEEKHFDIFEYKVFDDPTKTKETLDNPELELRKTYKARIICNEIKNILRTYMNNNTFLNIYACIEGISYGSTHGTKSIFDLAGLNYMIRNMLLNYDEINLVIAPPTHVKKFATGMGNSNKEAMIGAFKIIYPDLELPKIDDICDAYFMAQMAMKNSMIS